MYRDLNVYIDFDWEKLISDQKSYCNELDKIINFADQHKVTVYYLPEKIKEIQDIDEDFRVSLGDRLDVLLQNARAIDKQTNFLFEVVYSENNTSLKPVPYYISTKEKNCVISFNGAGINVYLNVKSSTEFEKCEVCICRSISDLHNWIITNVPKRNYNFNPKHGNEVCKAYENNKGDSVSQLKCSDIEAQGLLNSAIPDFREKEKHLYNFDTKHKLFIVFYYEGDNPQRFWHGFHIEENEWNKQIPKSILRFFEEKCN